MKKYFPISILLATPIVLGLCLMMGSSGFGIPSDRAITDIRLFRVLCGFITGAGLACSGVVLQALLRNPLAEPYVLGVSSGAGLGAAIAITTGAATAFIFAVPVSAFIFAVITLTLVYLLGSRGGRLSIYGLILSGVIVSALCLSLLMFIVAVAPREGLHDIIWWMLGNLEVYSKPLLAVASTVVLLGLIAAWIISPELNALSLGSDMAHNVGIRTKAAISVGLALATLITSAAVSVSGLIGFVGLVVPHVVRSLVGPDHKRLIPVTALAGGLFLALCDGVARSAFGSLGIPEIPVGVITALIGGPFFLIILTTQRKKGWVE